MNKRQMIKYCFSDLKSALCSTTTVTLETIADLGSILFIYFRSDFNSLFRLFIVSCGMGTDRALG